MIVCIKIPRLVVRPVTSDRPPATGRQRSLASGWFASPTLDGILPRPVIAQQSANGKMGLFRGTHV